MFNRVELAAGALSVIAIIAALYLVQERLNPVSQKVATQTAQAPQAGLIIVDDSSTDSSASLSEIIENSFDNQSNISRLITEDIKPGTGDQVKIGDTVLVHYAGRLQTGQEFDNSRKRGKPFEFTVGASEVIAGWDEGVVGMKEGGQRILVIPPDKAYGEDGFGPVPANATLVFMIDLLEIN